MSANRPYMDVDHPDAFKDMGVKDSSGYGDHFKDPALCPKCKGHGGWNLRLNAYGPGVHFRCACSQCNGYGYVETGSKDAVCAHRFDERGIGWVREYNRNFPDKKIHHWGMHCHVEVCQKCGEVRVYDSSG